MIGIGGPRMLAAVAAFAGGTVERDSKGKLKSWKSSGGSADLAIKVVNLVKLFKNGRNQAVRIPREFELPGDDAIMRRDGDKLIIEAAPVKSLLAILAGLEPIDDAFPGIEDRPPDAVEL